jgi:hypothetical protein
MRDNGHLPGRHDLSFSGLNGPSGALSCRFLCNEKFGHLALEYDLWSWNFGKSSFDNVEAFVSKLYEKQLISKEQLQALMDKIDEGREIDNMYDIKAYTCTLSYLRPCNHHIFHQ